eukprot:4577578-Pyramimonas_sp.AAC.2
MHDEIHSYLAAPPLYFFHLAGGGEAEAAVQRHRLDLTRVLPEEALPARGQVEHHAHTPREEHQLVAPRVEQAARRGRFRAAEPEHVLHQQLQRWWIPRGISVILSEQSPRLANTLGGK